MPSAKASDAGQVNELDAKHDRSRYAVFFLCFIPLDNLVWKTALREISVSDISALLHFETTVIYIVYDYLSNSAKSESDCSPRDSFISSEKYAHWSISTLFVLKLVTPI